MGNGDSSEHDVARYRSGVAARLAGLPLATLRVWERRYRLSDTGRSAPIRQLRARGCTAARTPGDLAEIVLLCQAALPAGPNGPVAPLPPARAPAAAPRKFDDQALAVLGAAHNNLYCDCSRHLSEILPMLNSFER